MNVCKRSGRTPPLLYVGVGEGEMTSSYFTSCPLWWLEAFALGSKIGRTGTAPHTQKHLAEQVVHLTQAS